MNNYLAHAELLLLVTGGGHRISVILLGFRLVLPDLLHLELSKITNIATLTNEFPQPPKSYIRVISSHLFHQLDGALHIPLGAQQLGSSKFLPNLFREVVHTIRLAGHLNNQVGPCLWWWRWWWWWWQWCWPAPTSSLRASWVSASFFFACSVFLSQSDTKEARWSQASTWSNVNEHINQFELWNLTS